MWLSNTGSLSLRELIQTRNCFQQVNALSSSELCIYPSESGKSSLHYTMQMLKTDLPNVLIKVWLSRFLWCKSFYPHAPRGLVKKGTRWSNLHKYKRLTERLSNRSWSFVNSALFIFRVTRTSIALLFTWMRVKAIHTSCWLKEMTCSLSCLQLVSVQHFMLNRVEPSVSVGWAHWWEISYCSNILLS